MALLTNISGEFARLYKNDGLACLESLENSDSELVQLIRDIAKKYKGEGIELNSDKLLHELNRFAEYAKKMDESIV